MYVYIYIYRYIRSKRVGQVKPMLPELVPVLLANMVTRRSKQ